MSDELPDERLDNPILPKLGFTTDDERIARMEKELATPRRALLILAEDRPDLLRC